jgi:hypothetical protein
MIFGRLWEEGLENGETSAENQLNIHDSRSAGFRKATRELRQNTIIEELE